MLPLTKVTDIKLHQTIFGRLFGYSEFIVQSAGQEQALSRIPFMPYPKEILKQILSQDLLKEIADLIFPEDGGTRRGRSGSLARSDRSSQAPGARKGRPDNRGRAAGAVPLGNSIVSLTCPFRQRGWCGDGWLTRCCSRSSVC